MCNKTNRFHVIYLIVFGNLKDINLTLLCCAANNSKLVTLNDLTIPPITSRLN